MRIVVYDCGWGGDVFAERMETEMPVVQVVRVIDWRHAPYCERSEVEIRRLTEEALLGFIGRVDAIVLASYEVTVAALKYLRLKYPEQVFVGMSWPILRSDARRVVIMTTDLVRRSRAFRRTRRRWANRVVVQKCDDWMRGVDDGELSLREREVRHATARSRREKPQIVVLGCTNLMDAKARAEIEELYFGAAVLDGYKATMRSMCRMLRIRGATVDRG